MRQIILDFGVLKLGDWALPLRVYGYGLMLVLGFLTGIALATWRARRAGEDMDAVTQCGVWALVGGIAGSRLAYVVQHWDEQFAHEANPLWAIVNISSGGLIYYGGVLGAVLLVVAYVKFKKLSIRRYLDFLAVSMMVGLAFGRAGCLLNGCCYGGPCSENWILATHFPMYSQPLLKLDGRANPYSLNTEGPSPAYDHQMETGEVKPDPSLVKPGPTLMDRQGHPLPPRLVPPRDFTPEQIARAEASQTRAIQPSQALGIVNALVLAALLTWFYRLRTREGQVFLLLLMFYPVTRFIEESIRDDNPHNLLQGVLTHNQYTSAVTFVVAAVLMILLRKLPASAGPAMAERQAMELAAAAPRGGTKRNHKSKN